MTESRGLLDDQSYRLNTANSIFYPAEASAVRQPPGDNNEMVFSIKEPYQAFILTSDQMVYQNTVKLSSGEAEMVSSSNSAVYLN
jgi:hypothetical protein